MDSKEFNEELKKWLSTDTERVSTAVDNRLLRGILYGDFDAGKTTLMGQIVKEHGGRAMLFNTDSNWVVLQKDPDAAVLIDRKPFQSLTQLRMFAKAHDEGVEGFADYDWLLWDTASTGIYRILRKLVKGLKFADQRHPELESWSHYNMVRAKAMETIEELNQSNLNIIYTCHDQEPSSAEKGTADGGRIVKKFAARPNMPEATFKQFAQEVSLVGWLFKEDEGAERQITFEGTTKRVAKSQIPGIEEKTYPVTEIPKLVRKWQQHD
jgi:phage nucleotide-binding protein